MGKDFINLCLEVSGEKGSNKEPFFKQALKDYWQVTSITPLEFRFLVRDVTEKWGEETVTEITKKHLVTCSLDGFTCPVCEIPIMFSSRFKLKKILANQNSMHTYCTSEEHCECLEKKIKEHAHNLFFFYENDYLGQPKWSTFDASPIDLLKMLSVYLEVGTSPSSIYIKESYEEEKGLLPYTGSLLPELVRKGYIFYVDEDIPYPDDIIRSMEFLNEYYPEDREPGTLGVHFALSLSRLGKREIYEGYRINPVEIYDGDDIVDVCVELIQREAYTREFLEEVESMLIDARAKTLLHIVKLVAEDYKLPISYLSNSDLIMKRLANEVSIETAIKLCSFAAERCRYLISKPGIPEYVKTRYFLSTLSDSFEERKSNNNLELPKQADFDFQNECGFDSAVFLVFNINCDLNTLSVGQVMKKLYLNLAEIEQYNGQEKLATDL